MTTGKAGKERVLSPQDLLSFITQQVLALKQELSLLKRTDAINPHLLLKLAQGEIKEIEEEHNSSPIDRDKFLNEIIDAILFLLSWVHAKDRKQLHQLRNHSHFDGVALSPDNSPSSASYEKLSEMILSLVDKDKDLHQVLSRLLKMTLVVDVNSSYQAQAILDSLKRVIAGIKQNRPPEFFTDRDPYYLMSTSTSIRSFSAGSDDRLSDEECVEKYKFMSQAFRSLRNGLGNPLPENRWWVFADLLVEWKAPKAEHNLKFLKERIEKFKLIEQSVLDNDLGGVQSQQIVDLNQPVNPVRLGIETADQAARYVANQRNGRQNSGPFVNSRDILLGVGESGRNDQPTATFASTAGQRAGINPPIETMEQIKNRLWLARAFKSLDIPTQTSILSSLKLLGVSSAKFEDVFFGSLL